MLDGTDEEQGERETREERKERVESGHHGTPREGPLRPASTRVRTWSPLSGSITPTTPKSPERVKRSGDASWETTREWDHSFGTSLPRTVRA